MNVTFQIVPFFVKGSGGHSSFLQLLFASTKEDFQSFVERKISGSLHGGTLDALDAVDNLNTNRVVRDVRALPIYETLKQLSLFLYLNRKIDKRSLVSWLKELRQNVMSTVVRQFE